MRLPLLLTALALLCAACDSAERCTTDDDCFSQERCVKAAGASEGSCDKIVIPADMGVDLDIPGRDMEPGPGDMGPGDMDAPDLSPVEGTLAQCLSQGCANRGGSCVSIGREVRCAMPSELTACLERRLLDGLDAQQPVRAHALSSGVARSAVIMGTKRLERDKLISFELAGAAMPLRPLQHDMPGASQVEALASYNIGRGERAVAAVSYSGVGGSRLLSLPSFMTHGIDPSARQLWEGDIDSVDSTYCGGSTQTVQLTQLCEGAPVKLRAAPQTLAGDVQDLIMAACMQGAGGMTNVLFQLRPGDPTTASQDTPRVAALDACGAATQMLSVTQIDAGLGGEPSVSASTGHVWTLQQGTEPVARRYDWRGSDLVGVSAMQFAHQQTKGMSDELLLTKVRAECEADPAAKWESRAQMSLLGSELDRDQFFYFGAIGGRAVAVQYRLGQDSSAILCPRAWAGMRWVDAVQTADGWLAVGKKSAESGVVIMRSRPSQKGADYLQLTNILRSGEELEPLALISHRDGSASLLVRRGAEPDAAISHIYLDEEGAPECP